MKNFSPNDFGEVKRMAAMHLPMIDSGPATGNGLEGFARIFYDTDTQSPEFGLAEQALAAAAVNRQILLRDINITDIKTANIRQARMDRAWAKVKASATKRLEITFKNNTQIPESEVSAAIQKIKTMSNTGLVPKIETEKELGFNAESSLVRRRDIVSKSAGIQARAEICDADIKLCGSNKLPIRVVRYTMDLDEMLRFEDTFQSSLEDANKGLLRKRMLLPLPLKQSDTYKTTQPKLNPQSTSSKNKTDIPYAQIIAVKTSSNGEILRFWQNSELPIFAGTGGRSSSANGVIPRDWTKEIRDIGSIAKVPLALLFASLGDKPDTLYCRKYFSGRTDSNGSIGYKDCNEQGAKISASDAFAQSSNLAMRDRLQSVDKNTLIRLADKFQLVLPPDVDPRTAFAFGSVRAAPSDILGLMLQINAKLDGVKHNTYPRLIRSITGSSSHKSKVQLTKANFTEAVDFYLENDSAINYIKKTLSAPIDSNSGTLSFLKNPPFSAIDGVAKTGTVLASDEINTVEKIAVGVVTVSGSKVKKGFLLIIRTPEPKYPLGRKLAPKDFRPLFESLLKE
jgi:hypothetical protein